MAAKKKRRRQHRTVIDPAWLRAARDAAAITQDELAKRLDIGFATVSNRETGAYKVYLETYLAVLNACGLPMGWKPGDPIPGQDGADSVATAARR